MHQEPSCCSCWVGNTFNALFAWTVVSMLIPSRSNFHRKATTAPNARRDGTAPTQALVVSKILLKICAPTNCSWNVEVLSVRVADERNRADPEQLRSNGVQQ